MGAVFFHLAGGLHVARDAGHVWGELLVLQQGDGLGADAFERVDTPVDGPQVDVERPGHRQRRTDGPMQSSVPVSIAEAITGHGRNASEFARYGSVGYTQEQKFTS